MFPSSSSSFSSSFDSPTFLVVGHIFPKASALETGQQGQGTPTIKRWTCANNPHPSACQKLSLPSLSTSISKAKNHSANTAHTLNAAASVEEQKENNTSCVHWRNIYLFYSINNNDRSLAQHIMWRPPSSCFKGVYIDGVPVKSHCYLTEHIDFKRSREAV